MPLRFAIIHDSNSSAGSIYSAFFQAEFMLRSSFYLIARLLFVLGSFLDVTSLSKRDVQF
ncbi:hypothetical protein [Thalassotalea castellviae]|uniref:Uncharacterized protein n=1 Tax=Thalassotalea castellviae TaxID=3075612 RepID=A0ABU3A3U1_9GAMM|nr:hypothetical protein [Thalassotalea sp. W431]MDT0604533.1 hypothetical protein [Thalassotalea sp. W431]